MTEERKDVGPKLVFPVRIRVDVRDIGGGEAELEYTEWYPEGAPVERTVEVAREMLMMGAYAGRSDVRRNDDGSITMRLTGRRDDIYSMLASEFMFNSPLGRTTLAELLVSVALGALPRDRLERLKEAGE
jgi:hypothetical protein